MQEATQDKSTPMTLLMNPRLPTQWVDNIRITARTGDFDALVLSGFQQVPGAEERFEVSRIMLSLAHAERLIEAMQNVIAKHKELKGDEM